MGKLTRQFGRHVMVALSTLISTQALAIGLGNIEVHSALGEPFRARLPVLGQDYTAGCAKVQLETLDGDLLARGKVVLHQAGRDDFLNITSDAFIHEPVIQVRATLQCGPSMVRLFQVLLDLPLSVKQTRNAGLAGTAKNNPVLSESTSLPVKASALAATAARRMNSGGSTSDSAVVQRPTGARETRPPRLSKAATTVAAPVRDVLRLSADEPQETAWKLHLPLKLGVSPALSSLTATSYVSDSNAKAIHARFVAALKEQDGAVLAPVVSNRLQQELQEVGADNTRSQEQLDAGKISEAAGQQRLVSWIQVLMVVLTVAVALGGYLVWRTAVLQSQQRQRNWERLTADDDAVSFKHSMSAASYDAETPATKAVGEFSTQWQPEKPDQRCEAQDEADVPSALYEVEEPELPAMEFAPVDVDAKTRKRNQMRMASALKHGQAPYIYTDFADHAEAPIFSSRKSQLEVEEVSDLLDITEMWAALNQPEKALEIIEPFRDIENPTSPVPWIALLQTYSALNNRENYEVMAARVKAMFNVKTPSWEKREEWNTQKSLSDFPHIKQKIISLWRSAELVGYLNSLIVDNRRGEREGFDANVFKELLRLLQLAHDPQRMSSEQTLLDENAYKILFAQPSRPPRRENEHEVMLDGLSLAS